jgi:excisionase family DNA binding protein
MTIEETIRSLVAQAVRDELDKRGAMPSNDEYISTADAARIARVTPGTIRRWVRGKQLARHGAGRVRIRRDELERYLSGDGETMTPEDRAKRRFG